MRTRIKTLAKDYGKTHKCSVCRKRKPLDDFSSNGRGYLHGWCRTCVNKDRRVRYATDPIGMRAIIYKSRNAAIRALNATIEPLKHKPCADCGGTFPSVVMDFDHRDPKTKTEPVSRMIGRALALTKILAEIAKCDLVCSNCHRIRTWIGGRRLNAERHAAA